MPGFDSKAFMGAAFVPRLEEIDVPGLADWFNGAIPVWVVRGQTASELAGSIDAGNKRRNIDTVIKALAANADQVDEMRRAIGIATQETHADVVRRLEMLTQCSVDPEITLDLAVRLAEVRPIEFYQLTNKIVELTGQGFDVKKSPPSGETTALEG